MSDREERPEDELTAAEFRQLFKAVSTWGRWGAEDERGALNYLTPARVLAGYAARPQRRDRDAEPPAEHATGSRQPRARGSPHDDDGR